jgi:tetratricopeptide (TPR) repeat protein
MRVSLIVMFIVFGFSVFAQKNSKQIKESYVDSLSYVYSMNGNYNELISLAKKSFDAEIDFYYLRYRIGISYFNQKKYLLAAEHFGKALEFYPGDFYTKEYLFYCNLYLNNLDEAKQIVLKLPLNSQSYYTKMLGKEKMLNIESGYQTTSYSNNQSANTFMGSDGVYAESDRMKSLQYYQIGVNFPISKKMKLYTGLSFVQNIRERHIYSNYMSYIYDYQNAVFNKSIKLKDTAQDYTLSQYQFYLGSTFNLPKRFSMQVGFQNMYYSQNKLAAQSDSSKSLFLDTLIYKYKYQINPSTLNNFVTSVSLSKTFSNFNSLIGFGYANIDETSIYQVGGQLTYSPLGNYNLNFTGGYYLSADSTKRNVGFAKVVGRITDSWWFEVYHYQGNLKNFHESNAYVVYNISDVIKSKSGINLAYYINPNWTLNFRYDYLTRSSTYVRYLSNSQSKFDDNYTTNSFIINLIWKF